MASLRGRPIQAAVNNLSEKGYSPIILNTNESTNVTTRDQAATTSGNTYVLAEFTVGQTRRIALVGGALVKLDLNDSGASNELGETANIILGVRSEDSEAIYDVKLAEFKYAFWYNKSWGDMDDADKNRALGLQFWSDEVVKEPGFRVISEGQELIVAVSEGDAGGNVVSMATADSQITIDAMRRTL